MRSFRVPLAFALFVGAVAGNSIAADDNTSSQPNSLYVLAAVRQAAEMEDFDSKPYRKFTKGGFAVELLTPVYVEHMRARALKRAEHDRDVEIPYSADFFLKECEESRNYVECSEDYLPVVTLRIEPQSGEGWGSFLAGSALSGISQGPVSVTSQTKYKADLGSCTVLVGDEEISPLRAQIGQRVLGDYTHTTTFGKRDVARPWLGSGGSVTHKMIGNDEARGGIFQFDPKAFRPRQGQWPTVIIKLVNEKKHTKEVIVKLSEVTVRQLWEDFQPYYDLVGISQELPGERPGSN